MIKISEDAAIERLTKTDLQVIDSELDALYEQAQNYDRVMTYQFFLDNETVVLVVYWDEVEVELFRF